MIQAKAKKLRSAEGLIVGVAVIIGVMAVTGVLAVVPNNQTSTLPVVVTISVAGGPGVPTQTLTLHQPLVAEAIARLASSLRTNFSYRTYGNAVLLDKFYGRNNNVQEQWVVRVNGQVINDLSTILATGDVIRLERQAGKL